MIQDRVVDALLTDSRRLTGAASAIFFAIDGLTRNGIDYVPVLYAKKVRCFILHQKYLHKIESSIPEANIIFVEDVVVALQELAAAHRQQFKYPVIGITGSNGKTIIKEWLYQLLSPALRIVRSPKSYNSQIGVPMSVWELSDHDELAIFEAGISRVGEMVKLQRVIDPEIGVLGFMGHAHAEGFVSHQQKIQEKLQLFKDAKLLIYHKDDVEVEAVVFEFSKSHPRLKTFSWGRSEYADLRLKTLKTLNDQAVLECEWKHGAFQFSIPFSDQASVFNAMTVVAVILQMEVAYQSIIAHTHELRQVEMRLELKPGVNQCAVINDSYSNDIDSLRIALDFLSLQASHAKKTLILSDLYQSSVDDKKLYDQIADMLLQKGLQQFIGIGKAIQKNTHCFAAISNTHFFPDTQSFIDAIEHLSFRNETILLKGSRSFEFEKISKLLEQQLHDTRLEINLSALRYNIKQYRSLLRPGVRMMAMVKAFGYGSGSHEIANLLQHEGVEYLAVAYADEGVSLRKENVRLPIMVMNPNPEDFDNLLKYQLEPELYSFRILKAFADHLRQQKVDAFPAHIKLDTGMHRLGFLASELQALITCLKENNSIKVQSIFSHLVASEDPQHDAFTTQQAAAFEAMTSTMEKQLGYVFLKHLCNTSAIHRHQHLQHDMVRLGIGMYGVDAHLPLQTVTTLKSSIAQIKKLKKGDTVGYGRKGVINQDSEIATVRVGYADGYPRALSNGNGKMLVNGHLASVIGNVCMDMTMIDITGMDVQEGDEVIVFGLEPNVSQLAAWADTIPYEILTGIAQRVKRIYFEE
jgi:alanine racemase